MVILNKKQRERKYTMNKENNFNENYGCSLEHFIQNEYSICREERQYALFLYNILLKYKKSETRKSDTIKEIFNACQIPENAEIEQVFYEATFMRDFFERNRRITLGENNEKKLLQKTFSPNQCKTRDEDSFNSKLIQYVHKKESGSDEPIPYLGGEYNLGHNEIDCDDLSDKEKYIIRCMMNAKPDIAVIYNEDGIRNLLFLECKFESGEDSYNSGEKQTKIQWKIAEFLCEYYLLEQLKVSDKMENEESCLIQFVRQKGISRSKNLPKEILINDLIEMNNKIFLS